MCLAKTQFKNRLTNITKNEQDFFDNLFLLGVGGCTVYSGPATEARAYFERLGYIMPRGESQADWFLDIASGDMEPDNVNDEEVATNSNGAFEGERDNDTLLSYADDALVKAQLRRETLYHQWEDHYKNIPRENSPKYTRRQNHSACPIRPDEFRVCANSSFSFAEIAS